MYYLNVFFLKFSILFLSLNILASSHQNAGATDPFNEVNRPTFGFAMFNQRLGLLNGAYPISVTEGKRSRYIISLVNNWHRSPTDLSIIPACFKSLNGSKDCREIIDYRLIDLSFLSFSEAFSSTNLQLLVGKLDSGIEANPLIITEPKEDETEYYIREDLSLVHSQIEANFRFDPVFFGEYVIPEKTLHSLDDSNQEYLKHKIKSLMTPPIATTGGCLENPKGIIYPSFSSKNSFIGFILTDENGNSETVTSDKELLAFLRNSIIAATISLEFEFSETAKKRADITERIKRWYHQNYTLQTITQFPRDLIEIYQSQLLQITWGALTVGTVLKIGLTIRDYLKPKKFQGKIKPKPPFNGWPSNADDLLKDKDDDKKKPKPRDKHSSHNRNLFRFGKEGTIPVLDDEDIDTQEAIENSLTAQAATKNQIAQAKASIKRESSRLESEAREANIDPRRWLSELDRLRARIPDGGILSYTPEIAVLTITDLNNRMLEGKKIIDEAEDFIEKKRSGKKGSTQAQLQQNSRHQSGAAAAASTAQIPPNRIERSAQAEAYLEDTESNVRNQIEGRINNLIVNFERFIANGGRSSANVIVPIQSLPGWFEDHAGDYRIYFEILSGGIIRIETIGHKNTQKKDIERLKIG